MSNVYFCFLSITECNPDTLPKFGIVDFGNAEIISLQRVFPTSRNSFVTFPESKLDIRTIVKLSLMKRMNH